jgi:hypothetical protein
LCLPNHFFVFAESISYSGTVGRDAGDGEAALEGRRRGELQPTPPAGKPPKSASPEGSSAAVLHLDSPAREEERRGGVGPEKTGTERESGARSFGLDRYESGARAKDRT